MNEKNTNKKNKKKKKKPHTHTHTTYGHQNLTGLTENRNSWNSKKNRSLFNKGKFKFRTREYAYN